jgi:hypothetical protein
MNPCARDFVREMKGFRKFWRKKHHSIKCYMDQSLIRETYEKPALAAVSWKTNDIPMTAVHNRIGSGAGLQTLARLGEPVS